MASSAAPASTTKPTRPRPPTPPREPNQTTNVSLKAVLGRPTPSDGSLSLQTPPNASTPTSSAVTDSQVVSGRSRKKVEWSPHTEYKEPTDYQKSGTFYKSSPLSAPASALSKPVKGILKPSPSPNLLASSLSIELDGSAAQPNIAEMLDSTIKQLAGSDRDLKLDAYMILARALKVSNNLPDRVALQDKMSLFMQFIQRDITSKTDTGTLDSSLINHALTLLATFLHFPAIASTLTSDFGIFILDHSIRSFEDTAVPKDIVRHLMQVVAFQNFSPKVMSSDRVGRLITALHEIENHLKGKSIVMSRIHIYKRLVKQSRSHMLTHLAWLQDMFADMLSPIKDIRAQAISLATEAGFALRSDKQLLRKASEILQTPNEDQTYIEFYINQLQDMLTERQASSSVPQIWSALILYMRCPLDGWRNYGSWFKLMQSTFNKTDLSTKQEANLAWNRYIYLSLHDSKLSAKALSNLCQPFLSQLRRKVNPKQLEEVMKLRRIVVGVVCSFYYYAFAPGNDKYSSDLIWDAGVQPLMAELISLDGKPDRPGDCIMQASRMLTGLLDTATPRVWRQDRIMDPTAVTPDELPPLDSKWIRRNCDKVFQTVGPIIEKKFIDLSNKESLTYRLWHVLVGSVAAASAKDIKVSEDTAKFFAFTFSLLSNVWSTGSTGPEGSPNMLFLPSIKNFLSVLIDRLGMLPFTEKKLSMPLTNGYELATTDRPDKSREVIRSPLHHLFSMLCSTPPGGSEDDASCDLFQTVFEPFFHSKPTKFRVELARELVQLLPRSTPCPYDSWLLVTQNLRLSLETVGDSFGSTSSEGDRLLGPGYREFVSLLERGLSQQSHLPFQTWFSLFELVSEHVVKEFGDAGRALVLIEPLAKSFLESQASNSKALKATQALFEAAKPPRDRTAVEVARRRLWGAPVIAAKANGSDPLDSLYKLGCQTLRLFYDKFAYFDTLSEITPFMQTIEVFVVKCFANAGINTLAKLQNGLGPWIQDEKSQLLLNDDSSSLSKTIRRLWNRIAKELAGLGKLKKAEFNQIEPLLTAAFKSNHRYIVTKAAEAWNALAKDEESVECSDSLKSVVSAISSKVDILSSSEVKSSGGFGAQASSFIRPQEDSNPIVISSTSSQQDAQQTVGSTAVSAVISAVKRPQTRKRRPDATPESILQKPAKRTKTPKLRHDDSQIQFAPIASSPLVGESQHLTEHQKEVRERQRESAGLYSDAPTTSRGVSRESSPNKRKITSVLSEEQPQETTPRRGGSFEDLISLTPTPRRGPVLHIEDYNDPPSSPPIPRPYPLLSEIQSRSRVGSSLENWEFSSPPGSPVTSRQVVAQDVKPPSIQLTDDTEQTSSSKTKRSKRRSFVKSEFQDIIPSSIPIADEPSTNTDVPDKSSALVQLVQPQTPQTPSRKPRRRAARLEETPKSGDDEFVDARSSPVESSPRDGPPLSPEHDENDASFALSELDESSMLRLVVELESRPCGLMKNDNEALPEETSIRKKTGAHKSTTMVQSSFSESPSPETSRKPAKRVASPIIPSTPAAAPENTDRSGRRRKRKRGPKNHGDREKKRRIADNNDEKEEEENVEAQVVADEEQSAPPSLRRSGRRTTTGNNITTQEEEEIQRPPQPQTKEEASPEPQETTPAQTPSGMETRRSARKRQLELQEQEGSAKKQQADAKQSRRRTSKRHGEQRGGDTDEELLSQLVTESNAASQSQSQNAAVGEDIRSAVDNTSVDKRRAKRAAPNLVGKTVPEPRTTEAPAAEKKNDSPAIMEALERGLKQLRSASLTRDEVYKMEDMLMDMKRELFEAERRGRKD